MERVASALDSARGLRFAPLVRKSERAVLLRWFVEASLPNSKLASDSKRRQMLSTMRQTLRRMNAIVEERRVRRASVGSVGGAQFHVGGGMQASIEAAAAARAAEAKAKAGAAQAHHLSPAMLRLRNRCKGNNGSSKSTG